MRKKRLVWRLKPWFKWLISGFITLYIMAMIWILFAAIAIQEGLI